MSDTRDLAAAAAKDVSAQEASAWGVAVSPAGRAHFRPDIEGLRAVAIIAVLLYHVGLPGVPGGFVGVDVFYVISGFLITGLLEREFTATGRIDLIVFYARRARRLLPAALVVIAVTVVASAVLLSELRFPEVAGDGAAAALYVSNYRFALGATDYLAADIDPSPLLHYWSLAVEEQFYLIWPVMVMVGARVLSVGRLWWLVTPIAVASLGLSVVWTDIAAPWAFFSLPTRAWELAVGALIAIGALRMPARWPRSLATAMGVAGLAMIVAAAMLIDGSMPFPGLVALLPVVGTGLLIVAGERHDAVPTRLLASRLPRWFGRISYSLYLWHWPVLILVPLVIGRSDLPVMIGLAVVTIGVAELSTRYVEAPFREGRALRLPPARTVGLAAGTSVVVAVGALALGGILPALPSTPSVIADGGPNGAPRGSVAPGSTADATGRAPSARPGTSPTASAQSPPASGERLESVEPTPPPLPAGVLSGPLPADLQPSLRDARGDLPTSYGDGCHLDYAAVEPPPCLYGDAASTRTVALFGDSHAAQWLPTMQRLTDERGWRLVSMTKSGCPPAQASVWLRPFARPYRECDRWREQALERIRAEHPELVVIASAHDYEIVTDDGRHPIPERPEAWRAGLVDVLGAASDAAERVVVLADTPLHATDPLECLARHDLIERCVSDRGLLVDDVYAAMEADAAETAGVELVSPVAWLCDAVSCPLVMGNHLVYRDTQHVTASFATVLAGHLAWALDDGR
jgi:peptidoglycan/LPS O-acetylase OafA/YrhL